MINIIQRFIVAPNEVQTEFETQSLEGNAWKIQICILLQHKVLNPQIVCRATSHSGEVKHLSYINSCRFSHKKSDGFDLNKGNLQDLLNQNFFVLALTPDLCWYQHKFKIIFNDQKFTTDSPQSFSSYFCPIHFAQVRIS